MDSSLSFVWEDAPLPAVAAWLFEQRGVGLVWPSALDSATVSGSIVAGSVAEYVAAVGRRVGARPCLYGSTWSLDVSGEGAEIRVRIPAVALPDAEVESVAGQYDVRISRVGVGWVVSGKQVDVREACEALGVSSSASYTVDVLIVSVRDSDAVDAWIRGEFSGTMGLSLTDAASGTLHTASLDVVARAYRARSLGRVVYRPTLACLLGDSTVYQSVRAVPVAQQTVSDAGTVTTSGYDVVEVGTKLTVSVVQDAGDSVLTRVEWEKGEIVGESGDYPTSDTYSLTGTFRVPEGVPVVVTRVDGRTDSRSRYFLGMARTEAIERYVIVLRVTRGDDLLIGDGNAEGKAASAGLPAVSTEDGTSGVKVATE